MRGKFLAAKELIEAGKATVVALTMGHLGAALVTREEVLRAPHDPPITPRSAVGAGDSFLAALIWRLASERYLRRGFLPPGGRCRAPRLCSIPGGRHCAGRRTSRAWSIR